MKRRVFAIALVVIIAAIAILSTQTGELVTDIEIAATPERVWSIATDLGRYNEWNPQIVEAEGEIIEGAKLRIHVEENDGNSMTFKPTVTMVVPRREFRWLGRLFVPGLFDGEHIFEIHPTDNGTVRFVQRENFKGVLFAPFRKRLNTVTREGFEAMNVALKARAESEIE